LNGREDDVLWDEDHEENASSNDEIVDSDWLSQWCVSVVW
jgi:hypothetical protein